MSQFSWRDHSFLFANGKFKVRFKENYKSYLLNGTETPFDSDVLYCITKLGLECNIIARAISDMTDEERDMCWKITNDVQIPFELEYLSGDVEQWTQCPAVFLYLLSIGVYPFNQDHFETGDVIKKEGV